MTPETVTVRQMQLLLTALGLKESPIAKGRAFFDPDSDLMILLADRAEEAFVRPSDVASVRKHLVDLGYLEESEFAEFLATGKLPLPAR
jgi:hypothetical protein